MEFVSLSTYSDTLAPNPIVRQCTDRSGSRWFIHQYGEIWRVFPTKPATFDFCGGDETSLGDPSALRTIPYNNFDFEIEFADHVRDPHQLARTVISEDPNFGAVAPSGGRSIAKIHHASPFQYRYGSAYGVAYGRNDAGRTLSAATSLDRTDPMRAVQVLGRQRAVASYGSAADNPYTTNTGLGRSSSSLPIRPVARPIRSTFSLGPQYASGSYGSTAENTFPVNMASTRSPTGVFNQQVANAMRSMDSLAPQSTPWTYGGTSRSVYPSNRDIIRPDNIPLADAIADNTFDFGFTTPTFGSLHNTSRPHASAVAAFKDDHDFTRLPAVNHGLAGNISSDNGLLQSSNRRALIHTTLSSDLAVASHARLGGYPWSTPLQSSASVFTTYGQAMANQYQHPHQLASPAAANLNPSQNTQRPQQFPVQNLPLEIQVMILKWVVRAEKPVGVDVMGTNWVRRDFSLNLEFHAAARDRMPTYLDNVLPGALYSENVFECTTASSIRKLIRLSDGMFNHIHRINLPWTRVSLQCWKELRRLPNLKEVCIQGSPEYLNGSFAVSSAACTKQERLRKLKADIQHNLTTSARRANVSAVARFDPARKELRDLMVKKEVKFTFAVVYHKRFAGHPGRYITFATKYHIELVGDGPAYQLVLIEDGFYKP